MAVYPTPVTHMNKKQLTSICRYENIDYTAETTQAALVALIEA
jgi:hypothetical protein